MPDRRWLPWDEQDIELWLEKIRAPLEEVKALVKIGHEATPPESWSEGVTIFFNPNGDHAVAPKLASRQLQIRLR